MSELDFDELDRAVSTLMNDVPKAEPPKTDTIKTLNIDSTVAGDSRPSFAKLDSALSEVNRSAAQPAERTDVSAPERPAAPSLATRRGGRFMDVVHPSSDMKTAVRPSRQGVTIEPAAGAQLADTDTRKVNDIITPANTVDTAAPAPAEPTPAAPVMSELHESAKNDWPDPLDMSGYVAEPATGITPEPVKEAGIDTTAITETPIEPVVTAEPEAEEEDVQPLTSPFITDAKVEKRPLGGVPTDTPVEEPEHAPVLGALAADEPTPEATSAAEQLPADPADHTPQLPPELQSDLMAIETDTVVAPEVQQAPAVEEKKPTPEVRDMPAAAPAPVSVAAAAAANVASGPVSIPQQYKEAPSTSDDEAGSIYDTDSYHQPLAHPAKAKSGWLWIVWILLLLIVGGGGAVALYFLGII